MKYILSIVLLVLGSSLSFAQDGVDLDSLKAQLNGDGLGGWVHGAVTEQSMFVFTWRSPDNFFVNIQLPMQSENEEVRAQLASLSRHDYVVLKGDFFDNKAPINHISVTEVVSVKYWDGPSGDHNYAAIPEEILNQVEATVKVHAVANDGFVLVVEYKDRVFPVFNQNKALVQDLYRNDIIRLKYLASVKDNRPIHLAVNSRVENPITVLNRIEDGHGEPIELTGDLVMFPKSPQIKFNVYALRIEDENGLRRNYTLINFEDADLFFAIRDKLEAAWKSKTETAVYDRNKFINRKIKVTAKGLKNVVAKNQANPQIVPSRLEDVSVTFID